MSIVTMDMSSFAIESAAPMRTDYADEVLDAGWNPQLALQLHTLPVSSPSEHHALPRSLAVADVPAFLAQMYASQR